MPIEQRLLVAGFESVDPYRDTTRGSLVSWTTPKSSARGDIAVLYGKRPVQAFVAVMRQCTDPVASKKMPGEHFAWFQIQPIGRDVPLSAAQADRALGDWGLLRNLQGRPKKIPLERRSGLFRLLLGRDQKLRKRIDAWADGKGRYPSPDLLPARELRNASWTESIVSTLSEDHERWISDEIAEKLVKRGRGRWIREEDPLSSTYWDEYPLKLSDGRRKYADIVLVSKEDPRPTLLLIEVKKRAEGSPARNPVPQVLRYRDLLAAQEPGWKVKPIVAALTYSPAVLEQAKAEGVEALLFDRKRNRLAQA